MPSERELQLFGPPRRCSSSKRFRSSATTVALGAAVFVYDVSEIHRVDSVRRDFVANVSHELKTPIGALEVLSETLVSETDPTVRRRLAESLVKEADRLGQDRRRPPRPQPHRDAGSAGASRCR